jgi:transposase
LYGLEVWRMIRNLKDRGISNREIASHMGISRNTVSRMLKRTRLHEKKKRKRGLKLDPYRERIRALCKRPFKFTHFRPLKSIQKGPLNIYHPLHFNAGDGEYANSGGLAYV